MNKTSAAIPQRLIILVRTHALLLLQKKLGYNPFDLRIAYYDPSEERYYFGFGYADDMQESFKIFVTQDSLWEVMQSTEQYRAGLMPDLDSKISEQINAVDFDAIRIDA